MDPWPFPTLAPASSLSSPSAGKLLATKPQTPIKTSHLITPLSNRSLRERVFKLFISRGVPANQTLAAAILRLRARRAALLG